MKSKSILSLYMSKRQRKRRRKEGEGRYVGRPKILSNPLPNKDLDSTVPFIDDFSTEECETDIGEFIFNFNVEGSKEKENMAKMKAKFHYTGDLVFQMTSMQWIRNEFT